MMRRKKEKVGEEERRKMEREQKQEKLKDRDKGQEAFFFNFQDDHQSFFQSCISSKNIIFRDENENFFLSV